MLLPNASSATVDLRKLRDYALNPESPRGKHKARVFASALGLASGDAEWLRDQILEGVREADATLGVADEHGQRYVVDLSISTPEATAIVRTAWIVRTGETFPRLASLYIR